MDKDWEKRSREFRAWLESEDFATRIHSCYEQYLKENEAHE